MRHLKFFICVVIAVVMFYSCRITRNECFKLPEGLKYAEQLLKDVAYDGLDYQLGLPYIPLIVKRNNIGIYAFTTSSAHRTYYRVFMFDGNEFHFSNIDQESELVDFLKQNDFSKIEQKLLHKRIKKIRKHNEEFRKSQSW